MLRYPRYRYHLIQVSSQLDAARYCHNKSGSCLPANLGQWMYSNTKHCASDSPYSSASRMPVAWTRHKELPKMRQENQIRLDPLDLEWFKATMCICRSGPSPLDFETLPNEGSSTSMHFQSLNSFLSKYERTICVKFRSNMFFVMSLYFCKNYVLACFVCTRIYAF